MKHDSLLRDEQGSPSMGRILLVVVVANTLALVWLDSAGVVTVENAAWALLSAFLMTMIAWVAGPRIAQYLLPQIGAITQGIGASVRAKALDRRDTERGIDPSP